MFVNISRKYFLLIASNNTYIRDFSPQKSGKTQPYQNSEKCQSPEKPSKHLDIAAANSRIYPFKSNSYQ